MITVRPGTKHETVSGWQRSQQMVGGTTLHLAQQSFGALSSTEKQVSNKTRVVKEIPTVVTKKGVRVYTPAARVAWEAMGIDE